MSVEPEKWHLELRSVGAKKLISIANLPGERVALKFRALPHAVVVVPVASNSCGPAAVNRASLSP
jgi:hypothetical protein